jgi:hypothetical protein
MKVRPAPGDHRWQRGALHAATTHDRRRGASSHRPGCGATIGPMRFVHLVKINDPDDPSVEPMTREQVWRGLVQRAERPEDFAPQMQGSRIIARGEASLVRELDFGSFRVRDRVRLLPMEEMLIETQAASEVPSARLCITIEEPGPEQLDVRFEYQIEHQAQAELLETDVCDQLLKRAYYEADLDCVRLLRRRAQAGLI